MNRLSEFWAWLRARPFWPAPVAPTIIIGGWRLIVRPLALGALEELTLAGHIQAITAYQRAGLEQELAAREGRSAPLVAPEAERAYLDAVLAVLGISLQRPRAWLLKRVTLADTAVVLALIYQHSGFITREAGSGPKAKTAP
jgi:hypothetical protein